MMRPRRSRCNGGACRCAPPPYGGRTFDDNGDLPFRVRLAGRRDVKVTAFSAPLLILVGGIVLVSHAAAAG